MKNIRNLMLGFSCITSVALFAQQTKPQNRPQIPHSHHTEHGGRILMFGDDHVEVVAAKRGGQATLYFSDKMRNEVALSEFQVNAIILDGNREIPLRVIASPLSKHVGLLSIPKEQQKNGVLKIKASRINPPKGHLTINTAQSLPLNQVFN
jgi:hypothetical protein